MAEAPDVLVERDPARMTEADLRAVLTVLDGLAVVGREAEQGRGGPEGPDWTLVLRWLQHGPVAADTEAALPEALMQLREHFAVHGRTPPARLDVVNQEGVRLLRVDPPDPGGNAPAAAGD